MFKCRYRDPNSNFFSGCSLCLLLIGPLAILLTHSAFGKAEISWYHMDWPAFSIGSGRFKGKGWAEKKVQLIIEQLPQFKHSVTYAHPLRMLVMSKFVSNICYFGSDFKYDKKKAIEFPRFIVDVPGRLYVSPKAIKALERIEPAAKSGKIVSLRKITASNELLLGKTFTTGFNTEVEEIIKSYKNTQNIYNLDQTTGIFKMLSAGRIDITVAFPDGYQYMLKMNPSIFKYHGKPIEFEIEENKKELRVFSYICQNLDDKVKQDLIALAPYVRKMRAAKDYFKDLEDWGVPISDHLRSVHRRLVQGEFDNVVGREIVEEE
jgi:uncharacterized protein (TIGR02285 family)